MSTFMIIRSQMYLIKQEEKHYENIINVYTDANAQLALKNRVDEVKNIEGVEAAITSNTGIYPMSLGIPGKDDSGDNLLMLELYEDCLEFLTMHHIELQDSLRVFHLMSRTPQPALINETFVDLLVPEGEVCARKRRTYKRYNYRYSKGFQKVLHDRPSGSLTNTPL